MTETVRIAKRDFFEAMKQQNDIDMLRAVLGDLVKARKTTFSLSFPPSVNEMFVNNRGRGRGRILSTFYRAWKIEAGWMLKAQKVKPHIGAFRLEILLDDSRSGDCDNRIKAVSDLLVSNGIVEGDQKKYMRGVSIDWARVDGCVVTIVEHKM